MMPSTIYDDDAVWDSRRSFWLDLFGTDALNVDYRIDSNDFVQMLRDWRAFNPDFDAIIGVHYARFLPWTALPISISNPQITQTDAIILPQSCKLFATIMTFVNAATYDLWLNQPMPVVRADLITLVNNCKIQMINTAVDARGGVSANRVQAIFQNTSVACQNMGLLIPIVQPIGPINMFGVVYAN